MEHTKQFYYNESKKLGYSGHLQWHGTKTSQWKEVYEELVNGVKEDWAETEGIEVTNFDQHHKSVKFGLSNGVGLTSLDNFTANDIKKWIEQKFSEVYYQTSVKDNYYQIKCVSAYTSAFSTHYLPNFDDVLNELYNKIDEILIRYNDEPLIIDYIEINYFEDVGEEIKGAYKTIETANDRWLILDTPTRKNCLYVCIYTAITWRKNNALLTDHNKRIHSTSHYKKELKKKNLLVDNVTTKNIREVAKKCGVRLRVYNNIYERTMTCGDNGPIIDIMISNRHAQLLILKSDILKVIPDFKFTEKVVKQYPDQDVRRIYGKPEQKVRDTRIAAWDLETYTENDRLVVYASGIALYRDDSIMCKQIFTDDKNLDKFMDYIEKNIELFDNYTFYAHCGGRFDLLLLLRDSLLKHKTFKIVGKSIIELNSSIIGLTIMHEKENADGLYICREIHFKDSYRIFQGKLKDVARDMGVPTQKGSLDHNIMNHNTILVHKDEILEYHKKDCICLLECVDKFSRIIFDMFKTNITSCYTAASLSKLIFRTHYIKNSCLYTLNKDDERFIRASYFGGRNECFAIGEIKGPLYYYDFTSLYPAVGRQKLPTGNCTRINDINNLRVHQETHNKKFSSNEPFLQFVFSRIYRTAFIRCMVKGSREMLKGAKPLHGMKQDGKLIFPYITDKIEITITSVELLYGLKLGYEYDVLEVLNFDKPHPFMNDFFTDCGNNKIASKNRGDEALTFTWKIIINSGYGFWGYNPKAHDTIEITYDNSSLYLTHLEKGTLKAINHVNGYLCMRVDNTKTPRDTNVSVAAYITSLARCRLHRAINMIEKKGGSVYYCDTDSIVTNLCLSDYPDLYPDFRPDKKGALLGGLKNEFGLDENGKDKSFDVIKIAGCKMYTCLLNNDGKQIDITHLKGYKKVYSDNDVLQSQATNFEISAMLRDETVYQEQDQLLCNKSDFLREGDEFNIRVKKIRKKFVKLYTKGTPGEVRDKYTVIESPQVP